MSEQLSLFERIVRDSPPDAVAVAEAMRNAIERYRAERRPLDANHTVPGKNPVSQDAARRALGKSGAARVRIYNIIKDTPNGLTADETRQLINLPFNSVSARICDLAAEGWLTDSGRRRETSTGAMATVWVVAND
jgi:hypothetical protein